MLAARDPHNSVRLILPDTLRRRGRDAGAVAGRGRARHRRHARPSRSTAWTSPVTTAGPQRTTGVIGALGPRPPARRRDAARAHAAQGQERPPRAAAGDPREPRPDLGAVARHRPLDPARSPRRLPDAPSPPPPTRTASTTRCGASTDPDHARRRSAERSPAPAWCWPTATTASRPPTPTAPSAGPPGIDDPGADSIMTLVVELAPGQLCVRAIHRLFDRRRRRRPPRRGWPARSRVDAAGPTCPRASPRSRPRCARRRPRTRRPRRPRAARSPNAELEARMAELPAELRDVDSARFDAGVLPAVPGVRSPTATTPPRSPRRSRRATPTPRCCCGRSPSTPSAPPPPPTAHAGEDDLLRAQAAHRHGVPQPRLRRGAATGGQPVVVPVTGWTSLRRRTRRCSPGTRRPTLPER